VLFRSVNGSENLPLKAGLVPVQAPRQKIQSMNPETAACLACHQSTAAASHALANTTTLGESCSACHGASADFSVSKSHVSEVQ
jgi:cytochrome c5